MDAVVPGLGREPESGQKSNAIRLMAVPKSPPTTALTRRRVTPDSVSGNPTCPRG